MRNIPDPGFANDAGEADPAVTSGLSAYDAGPERLHHTTLAMLQHARLLVPVTAVLGEVEYDDRGLAHDKTSDMATVLMSGQDGRLALLAFTSTESLHLWDPLARPVPVTAAKAAEAAVHDHASAMVIDVAGPVMFVVGEGDLRPMAEGYTLVQLGDRFAWARPAATSPRDAEPGA